MNKLNNLSPKQRKIFNIVGLIMMIVGFSIGIAGVVNLIITFSASLNGNSGDMPVYFVLSVIGIPMGFIGLFFHYIGLGNYGKEGSGNELGNNTSLTLNEMRLKNKNYRHEKIIINHIESVNCPKCGTLNDANNQYCVKCGELIPLKCPVCGTINEFNSQKCSNCTYQFKL